LNETPLMTSGWRRRLHVDGHASLLDSTDAVCTSGALRHCTITDHSASSAYSRTATTAERPVHDTHERLPKVGVNGAVEDEIERKVDGLERVGESDRQVVGVDVDAVVLGHVSYEVHDFGRNHQHKVHRHDDDQCQCDPVGRAAVAAAARAPSHPTSGCLNTHAQRAAQLDDEVDVAENEKDERRRDTDDEVRPLVGSLDGLMGCQPAAVDVVEVAAFEALNGEDLLSKEAWHIGKDADGENAGEGQSGEGASDDLAGVEWVADGNVSADSHCDREPGAGDDERVDQSVTVRRVHDAQVELTETESRSTDVCSRQDGDAE